MKKFYQLLLGLSFFLPATATNYYFSSSTGNDSYTILQAQNPSTPWKSLSKLKDIASSLKAGDSVLLKRGDTFVGSITFTQYGTANPQIVFSAYGTGNKPVISGLATLSNWVQAGTGIWESTCSSCGSTVNVLLVNNVLQEKGRYPNSDATNKGYLKYEAHSGNTSITDNELTSAINWTGAEVVIRKNRYVIDKNAVKQHSGTTVSYTASTSAYTPTDGFGYFFQNHVKALDKFGEWCYDSIQKKIKVFFGTNAPTNYKVEVSTIGTLVSNDYQSNIVFDNLTLKGANNYGLYIRYTSGTYIKNCDILFSGIEGVHLITTKNTKIESNSITYSNSNAINLDYGNTYTAIRYNKIGNTGIYPGMQGGDSRGGSSVIITGKGNLFEKNDVVNSGYNGVSFSVEDSTVIQNNFINTFCSIKDDGGGIYTYTGSTTESKGRKIIGNIILNGMGRPEGTNDPTNNPTNGIYLDERASGVEIRDNTVAFGPNYGIMAHKAHNLVIRNNTVFDNTKNQVSLVSDINYSAKNIELVKNTLVAKVPAQIVASFRSDANDIAQFGRFDSNVYARPLDDKLVIHNKYISSTVGTVEPMFDVTTWKTKGFDRASKKSPRLVKAYVLVKYNGANKFLNGSFTSNQSSSACGTGNANCAPLWKNDGLMDGGYLQIGFTSTSGKTPRTVVTFGSVGAVDSSKNYILNFTARTSSGNASVGVYLTKRTAPYTRLTPTQYIPFTNQKNAYQVLFSKPITDADVNIAFETYDQSISYLYDNVSLYDAEVAVTNPDNYILFNYNATSTAKQITFNGTYLGMDSVKYTGSATLQPYTSLILIKLDSTTSAPTSMLGELKTETSEASSIGQLSVTAYPNPTTSYINVSLKGNKANTRLNVINATGQVVQSINAIPENSSIQIGQHLAPGIYLIKVTDANEKKELRFVKM